jgi:uncharacterized membrane protein
LNISADLFSQGFLWLTNGVAAAMLILALFFINWRVVIANSHIHHVFGLCTVLLMLAWSLRAGISDGLGIHLFLITAVHLLMGWQLAIWVAALAISGTIALDLEAPEGFGVNMLVSVIVPLLTNYIVWRMHDRSNANHPFSFIFMVATLGGAISVFSSGACMTLILWGQNIYAFDQIVNEFWVFIPLIAAPEATINGMLISILIFNYPEWVRLFDEDRYFA